MPTQTAGFRPLLDIGFAGYLEITRVFLKSGSGALMLRLAMCSLFSFGFLSDWPMTSYNISDHEVQSRSMYKTCRPRNWVIDSTRIRDAETTKADAM